MAKIKGKWRWNDDVDTLPDSIYDLTADVHFSSNGEEFSQLKVEKYAIPLHVEIYYDSIIVQRCWLDDPYDENGDEDFEVDEFLDEKYRVMDFGETEQEISDELYAFILANATEYYSPISEKLVEVANNVPKVFEAGKQQGHDEGYDAGYKEGKEEGLNAGGYTEGWDTGYDQGYTDGEDAMWDIVQNYGTRTDYSYAFLKWSGEYIRPKYKVVPTGACRNIIYNCPDIKKIESAYFDLSQSSSPLNGYDFATCGKLEEVEDIGLKATTSTCDHAFAWDSVLRKVARIELNESTNVTNLLYCCYALEDVRIAGTIGQSGINLQYSPKLNKASIESFVNALTIEPAHQPKGKTITFSKKAVDNAFSGLVWDDTIGDTTWTDIGSESHTWLELIAPKIGTEENPMWNIILV